MEEKNNKEKVNGYIGSVIFHIALIGILIFLGFSSIPQEEEGILVNFGDSPAGFGVSEPVYNPPSGTRDIIRSTPSEPVAFTPSSSQPRNVRENLLTQDYEESAKLKAEEQKKRDEENRKILEQRREQERQQRIEAEKKRAEEQERQRIIEEEQRKQQEQERIAQQARSNVNQAFSRTQGTGSSEGVTQGTGNQGHLTGDPNATGRDGTGTGTSGNSFSLSGRSLVGSLPKPVENCNEEGDIVVEITVDKTGRVTAAQATPRGSKNFSACLIKAAVDAAKKARFNNDPNAAAYQTGTITYRFRFG